MNESSGEVTLLLNELKLGHKEAMGKLIPLVYRELRRLADHYLRGERGGHTIQPTALVHEVYLRLVEKDHPDWKNRAHFFGVAAQVMRGILVDYARARLTAKRAGNVIRIGMDGFEPGDEMPLDEILEVDEALGRLAALDPQQTRIVELRYFAGLTIEETAAAVGIIPWRQSTVWLSFLTRSQLAELGTAPRLRL